MLKQDELRDNMLKNPAGYKECDRLEIEEIALLDLLRKALREERLPRPRIYETKSLSY